MYKYCLPIIVSSKDEVLERIHQNRELYHYFEIWIDYLTSERLETVDHVSRELGNRAIFLFRRQRLEPIELPLETRGKILNLLSERESYVDLDVTTQQDDLDALRALQQRPDTILSFHDYQATPSDERLQELISQMDRLGASIVKISTFCKTENDALRLLSLVVELRSRGIRYIVLGMGEHGAITRIFGTLWGNEMIFAPTSREEASAPGQLTRAEVEECLQILTRLSEENTTS